MPFQKRADRFQPGPAGSHEVMVGPCQNDRFNLSQLVDEPFKIRHRGKLVLRAQDQQFRNGQLAQGRQARFELGVGGALLLDGAVRLAAFLLGLGLFTERAYCRFLCPLGGVLALLDKLHLVDLLKRRPECGNPCSLCERSCPVKAIAPTGKIIMAECFQCLDCQVEYFDDQRCPPLAAMRKLAVGG